MNIINNKYNNLKTYSSIFAIAKPYPYIILDNFLDETFFSNLNTDDFNINSEVNSFNTEFEKNKSTSKNLELSGNIQEILDALNKEEFLSNLHQLTGIKELFSTKKGNTALANYHEMYESGFLGSHVDHSSEPETGLPHVLNIILYLSKKWDNAWGGSTIFANKNGTQIKETINYVPNRAVIFLHSPFTFHGVTKITNNLNKRSSIYVDYYSKNTNPYNHFDLDFKNIWFKHPTTFILPKIKDYFLKKNRIYFKKMIKHCIKAFLA